MTEQLSPRAIGSDVERLDGRLKVTGRAPYAVEHPATGPSHLHALQSTVARGRVTRIDASAAEAMPGVVLVLTHDNAPRLASTEDAELAILQSPEVAFRGQLIGAVVAETPEIAREAARLVRVEYDVDEHDAKLDAERDDLYAPDTVNPQFPTDTQQGHIADGLASAEVTVDQTYTTAMYHNNPMEMHAAIASWPETGELVLYDSTQGAHSVRTTLADVLGLDPEHVHVVAPYVGGGFGSKGTPHAHNVLVAMAAQLLAPRPVKLALTRQQMFSLVGYRTPTIQHVRLGATRDGNLTAIATDVVEQTSKVKEFAEQTAVPTRMMYAARSRRTTHRLAALDVPVPSWMRAPGVCPGMFGPEVAMDELAEALGLDPIELRIHNDPGIDPQTGNPFSTRRLVDCLREGARRFGWDRRSAQPRSHSENGRLIGFGVAASTYPVHRMQKSSATVRFHESGCYRVEIGAIDIGTGAWTVLGQIAADALGVGYSDVEMLIGDTALPFASVAGGSSGTTTWGSAIVEAALAFRDKFGDSPRPGDEADGHVPENPDGDRFAMHAFGAQFAEVHVDESTGEIRVTRLLGMFDAGRIVNPRTARSQLIGGMTMGLSMALHEESVLDPRFGHVVNHDFAEYHIATNADVGSIEAFWLDGHDPHTNPMGSKGIGEIGIVGTAAAIANAAYNATGIRVRDLPITLDKLMPAGT